MSSAPPAVIATASSGANGFSATPGWSAAIPDEPNLAIVALVGTRNVATAGVDYRPDGTAGTAQALSLVPGFPIDDPQNSAELRVFALLNPAPSAASPTCHFTRSVSGGITGLAWALRGCNVDSLADLVRVVQTAVGAASTGPSRSLTGAQVGDLLIDAVIHISASAGNDLVASGAARDAEGFQVHGGTQAVSLNYGRRTTAPVSPLTFGWSAPPYGWAMAALAIAPPASGIDSGRTVHRFRRIGSAPARRFRRL